MWETLTCNNALRRIQCQLWNKAQNKQLVVKYESLQVTEMSNRLTAVNNIYTNKLGNYDMSNKARINLSYKSRQEILESNDWLPT